MIVEEACVLLLFDSSVVEALAQLLLRVYLLGMTCSGSASCDFPLGGDCDQHLVIVVL